LKCEDQEEQAKFMMEDMLTAVESPDSEMIKNQTPKKKSALCLLPICKSGTLASADEEEL